MPPIDEAYENPIENEELDEIVGDEDLDDEIVEDEDDDYEESDDEEDA